MPAGAASMRSANAGAEPWSASRSQYANSTAAPVRAANRGSRLMVSAWMPKNGANTPSPAFGCWSGRIPTTPPACSVRSSCRTAEPSAGTWVTRPWSSPRTRCRKASPIADSGGRYRIASGVRAASHWLSSSQLPWCGAATITPRPAAIASSSRPVPWNSRIRARLRACGRVHSASVSTAWRVVVRSTSRCRASRAAWSSAGKASSMLRRATRDSRASRQRHSAASTSPSACSQDHGRWPTSQANR